MSELILVRQIIGAFALGALIGFEREYHKSSAGLRTYAAIALGACLFGILSTHSSGPSIYHSVADPTRIAAQIVSGIGFIGGGVIFKSSTFTRGLTTAATIWVTAAIGLSVAFNMILVPITATILTIFLLSLNHFKFWKQLKKRHEFKGERDTE
ncbi:MAG TPA: MgtC/SapB family protein [Victivallales bacterium]|nr:MgtC/SapB family protein [Victivallales bacterium]